MKSFSFFVLTMVVCISFSACSKKSVLSDQSPTLSQPGIFQCIPVVLTIADKQIFSMLEYNTKTSESRLLNAASFADKSTGQQGNLIGWVPLTGLQQAAQNLATQIQSQQAARATNSPTPAKSGDQ
jgi:hypothetical protein